VVVGAEVVDHQRIDRVERQALQRLRIGPHDPVIGIVPDHLEIEPAHPWRAVEGLGVFRAGELAADLGRDEELVARLGAQEPAEPVFGKSASIPGRGVVVAHTRIPCGLHRGVGIGLGHLAVKLAQIGGAQAEGRQAEARRADPFRARNSIRQRSLPERTMADLPVRSSARM
jgi:hypothetical protein